MKHFSIKTYAPVLTTLAIVLLPLVTLAQGVNGANSPVPSGGNVPVSGSTATLDNPLRATNFCMLIKVVLDAILIIGMPIAVVFLVWVGFTFILAQGNPGKLADAQKNFLNTIIGIAIFLGAWTIAKIIAATLQGLGVSAVNECVR